MSRDTFKNLTSDPTKVSQEIDLQARSSFSKRVMRSSTNLHRDSHGSASSISVDNLSSTSGVSSTPPPYSKEVKEPIDELL
ncbi:hypothetical protein HanXRQr2_Chr14g0641951 [Helianthus annuus]|uniref:Uncharacterized protein n=1 Tax=Helianthus annuus TaxID=4232 RepID=A0A9K3E993_HELAN|nr:hypothetical protein HanXRQr2_Chr14g0641951 [Helianthus annuus]KAJ0840194.1 hypothetical protein HanPSC8_Chr14g0615771 [Helianthus annuus]